MKATIDPRQLPLRDIHFPDPVSWWPLAPGWWLLFILFVLLLGFGLLLIHRRHQYITSAVYIAKQELETIKNNFTANQDKVLLIKQLSVLIRRLSVSLYGRREVASLTGKAWLQFLDQFSADTEFSNGAARVLIEAPYQAAPEYDSTDLIIIISNWIEGIAKHRENSRHV